MAISSAFSLLLIGMITVFVVLLLVVLVGNALIFLVNRITPDNQGPLEGPTPKQIVVLTAAVEAVTQGTGNITKIEKI